MQFCCGLADKYLQEKQLQVITPEANTTNHALHAVIHFRAHVQAVDEGADRIQALGKVIDRVEKLSVTQDGAALAVSEVPDSKPPAGPVLPVLE